MILKWLKEETYLGVKIIGHGKVLDMGSTGFGEYNPSLHEFLKENVIGEVIGLDIKNADLIINLNNKTYSIESESYDTIIAGEIIEHLNHPIIFLEECKRILKPNGRIIIITPNMTSICYILGIIKNIDKKNYHCHAWNMDLFDALVYRSGLKVIHKKLFNKLASWDYILDLLTKIFPIFKTEMFYVLEKSD